LKLIDEIETILIVTATDLQAEAPDRLAADRLRQEVDRRGGGHPYRRAVILGDVAWFETPSFRESPTITIGGPGVNGVANRFGAELPTVWTADQQAVIQAEFTEGVRRVALWGMNAAETANAVQAFVSRGWLEEFLDRCWRYRAGVFA
jgi:hypothetical protein